jgi:REP element-mobilizing transposase RayT
MNKYNPDIHHRRSIRLKGYDYSQEGLYFITICTQNRECLFGKIVGFARPDNNNARPEMELNEYGKIVKTEWLNLKIKYPNIDLYEYIVMPNHFHGILQIVTPFVVTPVGAGFTRPDNTAGNVSNMTAGDKGAGEPRPYVPTLGNIIAYFKYQTTKQINLPHKLWQRNYFENIIRNDNSYQTISEYIINNPANWKSDKFFNDEKEVNNE